MCLYSQMKKSTILFWVLVGIVLFLALLWYFITKDPDWFP